MARGRSVQQQNHELKQALYQTAWHWRHEGIPEVLQAACERHGMDWRRAAFWIDDWKLPAYGMWTGILMSADKQIFFFVIENKNFVDSPQLQWLEWLNKILPPRWRETVWKNVTADYNFCERNKGFGKGWGVLAWEALQELNDEDNHL